MIITAIVFALLDVVKYTSIGIFNIYGFNYLEPFAWTFVQMIFLYFLPARKWFIYAYILGFTGISIGFGQLIQNLGITRINNLNFTRFVSPFIFLAWWSFTVWFFKRNERIKNQRGNSI